MRQANGFSLAGVMGWPVMHSRSPIMHNAWMAAYGVKGVYAPIETPQERLERALRALPALNFVGVNLTIPHKEAALKIVDHLSPAAKAIGAVNCVVVGADGALTGHNFDCVGYVSSLAEAAPDWRASAGPALVLGAGGAARAIVYGLLEAGAPKVIIANRSRARADDIARDFSGLFTGVIETIDWSDIPRAMEAAQLLVQTTSLGMKGQPQLALDLAPLPRAALVSDIVYAPLETDLLARARARGNRGVDGLGMLIHQARPAFYEWFGVTPEVTPQLRAAMEAGL
jgi:shikimate dehydrogenase